MLMTRSYLSQSLVTPEFESLIIIDRSIDLMTPMCSQVPIHWQCPLFK